LTCNIALLRAVNVTGYNRVAMTDLRGLLTNLGLENPRSLLQSGNLLFHGGRRSPIQLERLLERETASRLDLQTDFFVRTGAEWQQIVAANPFRREAARDPGHLIVMFLKAAPSAEHLRSLRAAIKGREVVDINDRHAFIVFPDGVGRSRLTTTLIERKLETRGTGRNWNTVLKLSALASETAGRLVAPVKAARR
jgi:uncharacterized protein (DUF1697 family)